MTWNCQKPDSPQFRWDGARLEDAEKEFLVIGGVFVGSIRHLGKDERDQLTIEAMSTEAVTTPKSKRDSGSRERAVFASQTTRPRHR
jgi:hypothetical protein